MTKQQLRQFSKRQNFACGLVNRLNSAGRITQSQATDYVGTILFSVGLTAEYLEEVIAELQTKI